MIAKILKLFAGSHYKRFYKKARPIVAKINKIEEQYQSLTDEQLRAKTDEFRARYANGYLEFMQHQMGSGYNHHSSHIACGI